MLVEGLSAHGNFKCCDLKRSLRQLTCKSRIDSLATLARGVAPLRTFTPRGFAPQLAHKEGSTAPRHPAAGVVQAAT